MRNSCLSRELQIEMTEANDPTAVTWKHQYPWERKLEVLKYYGIMRMAGTGIPTVQKFGADIKGAFIDGLLVMRKLRRAAKERSELAADEHHFCPMLRQNFSKSSRNVEPKA